MGFVSFSSQHVVDNTTSISNIFFNDFLPTLNADCLRVYLYGLYLCGSADRYDNTLEHFSSVLGLSQDDVISAFTFLQDKELVQILNLKPIEVKYLPLRRGMGKVRLYKKGKWDEFNAQIQAIIEGRQITPSEFADYYTLIESMHIQPDALLLIAKYCTDLKGKNVGSSYVQTVAKNWAYQGVKTIEAVQEKLEQDRVDTNVVVSVLKALGVKRSPEAEDFDLYAKWRKDMGFSDEVI